MTLQVKRCRSLPWCWGLNARSIDPGESVGWGYSRVEGDYLYKVTALQSREDRVWIEAVIPFPDCPPVGHKELVSPKRVNEFGPTDRPVRWLPDRAKR